MILFVSSELSSVQRISKTKRSLPVTVSTVVAPASEELPLVADVSMGTVITTMTLEGVIFVRALVSVAENMVLVSLVSDPEMLLAGIKVLSKVWVSRVCVSKGMWLCTEGSARPIVWEAPSELVLTPRGTADSSVWFIVTRGSGSWVLGPVLGKITW